MDLVTPKPDGVAARMWAAAAEAGISPHDPLAPFIDVMADATERIEAAAAKAAAPDPQVIESMTRDIGNRLLAQTKYFVDAANWRTAAIGAIALLLVGAACAGAGYWYGHSEWQQQEVVVKNDLGELVRAGGPSAAAALVLLRNNDLGRALATCQPIPQPSGRKACALVAWIEPPSAEAAPQK